MTSDPMFSHGPPLAAWTLAGVKSWPGGAEGGRWAQGPTPHLPSCLNPHHPSPQDYLGTGFVPHSPPWCPQLWAQGQVQTGPQPALLIPQPLTAFSSLTAQDLALALYHFRPEGPVEIWATPRAGGNETGDCRPSTVHQPIATNLPTHAGFLGPLARAARVSNPKYRTPSKIQISDKQQIPN